MLIDHLPAKDPTELADKHRLLNEAFATLLALNDSEFIDKDLKDLRRFMSRKLDEAYRSRRG